MRKLLKTVSRVGLMAAILLVNTSCDQDILDLTPQQSISDEDFLQTFSDFQGAIVAGYSQMSLPDWYGRYMLLVPDIMGDDVKQNASANRAKEWAEYNGSTTTTHRVERGFWREIYQAINATNRMINASFTPPGAVQAQFDQIIGEAHAIRALGHFDLVRLFAQHYSFTAGGSHPGVPIVLEFDPTGTPTKNTVGEVYARVISDFQTAISKMSSSSGKASRFSKEAAQALLARVYLYMEDWTNAEAMATAVISSGRYSLVSRADYPNQFLNGNSSEAILEMEYSLADNPGSNHVGGMYKETGYGDYLPSQGLIDMMDDADIRKTMFLVDGNLQGAYASSRVNKFPSSGAEIATDNIPVIRLSEVYLIRAEARAMSGNDGGAQSDLNMIRQRAWPGAANVTATGDALLAEISKERRIELSFEGHRLFDITRKKESVVRTDCTAPICTINYPNNLFVMPIPFEELDVNSNISQNPGY